MTTTTRAPSAKAVSCAPDKLPLTITSAEAVLRDSSLTSVELAKTVQARADALDSSSGVFMVRTNEAALAGATQADAELLGGASAIVTEIDLVRFDESVTTVLTAHFAGGVRLPTPRLADAVSGLWPPTLPAIEGGAMFTAADHLRPQRVRRTSLRSVPECPACATSSFSR